MHQFHCSSFIQIVTNCGKVLTDIKQELSRHFPLNNNPIQVTLINNKAETWNMLTREFVSFVTIFVLFRYCIKHNTQLCETYVYTNLFYHVTYGLLQNLGSVPYTTTTVIKRVLNVVMSWFER